MKKKLQQKTKWNVLHNVVKINQLVSICYMICFPNFLNHTLVFLIFMYSINLFEFLAKINREINNASLLTIYKIFKERTVFSFLSLMYHTKIMIDTLKVYTFKTSIEILLEIFAIQRDPHKSSIVELVFIMTTFRINVIKTRRS